MAKAKKTVKKTVETIRHEEASRKNIPTAEYQESEGNQLVAKAVWGLPSLAQGGRIIGPRDAPTIDYYLQRRSPR